MDEPYINTGNPSYNESSKIYSGNSGYYISEEVEVFKVIVCWNIENLIITKFIYILILKGIIN